MKAKILVDEMAPKIPLQTIRDVVASAGVEVVEASNDITIVVGGDGLFGRSARSEDAPLLFVGIRSADPNGTKAHMAEVLFDGLKQALEGIKIGHYGIVERDRLEVFKNGQSLGDVFTDVYMQRGIEPASLRYTIEVSFKGESFTEYGIGDGVVVATRSGSTGYYSYLDKIVAGDWLDAGRYALIGEDEIGICHIVPNAIERPGSKEQQIRYTVPIGSEITLSLTRSASALLYGTGGIVPVGIGDRIAIKKSPRTTKLIKV